MKNDIRVDVAFPRHLKTQHLIDALGEPGAPWALITLWAHCGEQRRDGALRGYRVRDVERAAGWWGAPGAFVRALLEVRLLEGDDATGYRVHDWAEHQPWIANSDERSEAARAAASTRWGKRQPRSAPQPAADAESCEPHADRIASADGPHAKGNAPTPDPTPTPDPIPDLRSPPTPPQAGGGEGVEVSDPGPGRGSRARPPRPGRQPKAPHAPPVENLTPSDVFALGGGPTPTLEPAWVALGLYQLRRAYDRSLLSRAQLLDVAAALREHHSSDVEAAVRSAIAAKREHWPPTVMLVAWAEEARRARVSRERVEAEEQRRREPDTPPSADDAVKSAVIRELVREGCRPADIEREAQRRIAARGGAAQRAAEG